MVAKDQESEELVSADQQPRKRRRQTHQTVAAEQSDWWFTGPQESIAAMPDSGNTENEAANAA